MVDQTRLAKIKREAEIQLRDDLFAIRHQLTSSKEQTWMDKLTDCVSPKLAYDGLSRLPIGLSHKRCRSPNKFGIVCHDVGLAIMKYWELIRTDDTVGLKPLLQKISDYAIYGIAQCEVLGGPDFGWFLWNPAAMEDSG